MPEFYHAPSPIIAKEDKPHVFIATPTTHLHANHVAAVLRAMPVLFIDGIAADHYLLDGQCHVDDARNTCVGAFLESEAEALIFIDADVGFPAEALWRLALAQGDIVAGAYPRKELPVTWPVRFDEEAGLVSEGEDGLIRTGVLGLPTGFMKIHRRVIEAMADVDKRRFKPFGAAHELECPVLFERDFESGERMSGDYAFCRKARLLGFELALDPHLPFTHAGEFRFAGRLIDQWRSVMQERAQPIVPAAGA